MGNPLDNLAASINAAMGGGKLFYASTLTRAEPTTSSPDVDADFDPPDFDETDYACQAIRDEYTQREIDGNEILRGDCKMLILGASVTVKPVRGDRVNYKNEGVIFHLINVLVDPANALYTCQARQ